MHKGDFTNNEDSCRDSDSDASNIGNLDLLKLRLSSSFNEKSINRIKKRVPKDDIGAGEPHKRHRHPLKKYEAALGPGPNLSRLPQGYGNAKNPSQKSSEQLVFLYSKDKDKLVNHTDQEEYDNFLYPNRRKQKTQSIDVGLDGDHQRSARVDPSSTFPFRPTPSGNLKINPDQVAFESEKLSVIVADPENIKIDFQQANKMSQGDYGKNTAMDAIMSQAGLSSLGSLINNTPTRSVNKESSEYDSKKTSEILDPELNLGRLGYGGTDTVNWEKVALPEKKNLYLELYSRITNYTNADCKVHIGDEEFNCHLIVLQCYSDLLDEYTAMRKVHLPIERVSPAAFSFIYEWMISGEPSYKELTRDFVLEIFNSAKYMKIKDLVEQCWAFIDSTEVFSEDTAFLLYMDAKTKDLPEVRELMLPRIQKFFLMLVSSQDWLELEVDDVLNLLKSNYVTVNCEMEIFMSAVRWLKHNWTNRDQYKYEVLGCVRFGNIAPWQLVDVKRNPENPDFMELAKDPQICKMIDDGLAYVIIKYWYGQENDDFQHWNTVLGLQEPPPRNWSGTDKTYFTYREFLIYLDQYRRNQLIEKNKPKVSEKKTTTNVTDQSHVPHESHPQPQHAHVDEFLAKKKPVSKKKVSKMTT